MSTAATITSALRKLTSILALLVVVAFVAAMSAAGSAQADDLQPTPDVVYSEGY